MQLGIFAKTFARPTLEGVFAAVASHGLTCVQFNFACAGLPSLPDEIPSPLADDIQLALGRHGITMAAVSGTFNLIHPDAQVRHDGLRRLRVIASVCHRLGARLITLCTGTRDPHDMWRRHPDNTSPAAWHDLLESLSTALALTEEFNVPLGIEPEVNNVVNSARAARRLLDELKSPRLKIVFDAANLFHPRQLPRRREILDQAFDLLGGDIALAHAKEFGRDGHAGNLPLGAGVIDWHDLVTRLRGAGFTGALVMHGITESEVATSTDLLRRVLAQA
jgi:sugar phosphate isomerase/epimerase